MKVFASFFKKKAFFFSEEKKQKTFICLLVGGVLLSHGAAAADRLSVCIDSTSASAPRDQKLAEAVARQEGVPLAIEHFNGSDDDDGVTAKEFRQLLSTRCELLMGYPVDVTDGFSPAGIKETRAYDQTGFVLVVPKGSPVKSLADLPKGTEVAVTFETAPNLYFLSHPGLVPDVHTTDAETLKTVVDGGVKAAMVWQPTVQMFLDNAENPKIAFFPLTEPHARWNVVALYTAQGAEAAQRFDAAVAGLKSTDGFDPSAVHRQNADGFDPAMVRRSAVATPPGDALPALYTAAQAAAGFGKYLGNCGMCHGAKLQGLAGPSLKGPNFASVKSNYAVSDIFNIVSQNMPAADPGTLPPQTYVEVMAYLLQQNGYPAGPTALTFEAASKSDVPLVYHGK